MVVCVFQVLREECSRPHTDAVWNANIISATPIVQDAKSWELTNRLSVEPVQLYGSQLNLIMADNFWGGWILGPPIRSSVVSSDANIIKFNFSV